MIDILRRERSHTGTRWSKKAADATILPMRPAHHDKGLVGKENDPVRHHRDIMYTRYLVPVAKKTNHVPVH
jgi:hypothetical protein